ncbi:Uu.00g133840.m01.CDS01 [Anthostomella pinea]|uniref:Uu.00g133840.m01.CDS01 n=1 Tax=Anthostomella pinea TaxID=933095 RepID=A0AAI8YKW2_9PEZI|nr:Uu.00g133840.m01.CDS01 [Anthostomella pinea]
MDPVVQTSKRQRDEDIAKIIDDATIKHTRRDHRPRSVGTTNIILALGSKVSTTWTRMFRHY